MSAQTTAGRTDERAGTPGLAVGVVGAARATVRPSGAIEVPLGPAGESQAATLFVEWWVGTGERWRRPARETTVRQHRIERSAVVETAMRIAGGDVVGRVWAVPVPGRAPTLISEIANDTASACSVALVLRAVGPRGAIPLVRDGVLVRLDGLDGTVVAQLPRLPLREGGALDRESLARVLAQQVLESTAQGSDQLVPDSAPDAGASIAVVFPVAHRTAVRLTIPIGPTVPGRTGPGSEQPVPDGPGDPVTAPGHDRAVSGWRALFGRATRVSVPDGALLDEIAEQRLVALMPACEAERLAPARIATLASWGHGAEAAEALRSYALLRCGSGGFRIAAGVEVSAGAFLDTFEVVNAFAGAGAASDRLFGLMEAAVEEALRRSRGRSRREPGAPLGVGAAALVPPSRNALVAEGPTGEVTVFDGFSASWVGQPVEVHDLPGSRGRLSVAIRWHGNRPALLWDCRPGWRGDPTGIVLRAPALDPTWTGRGATGEALLAAWDGLVPLGHGSALYDEAADDAASPGIDGLGDGGVFEA